MIKYKVVSRIVADKDCFEKRKDGDFNEKQLLILSVSS